jgi:uncharacterized glyoxalase superfamily protein PhnB
MNPLRVTVSLPTGDLRRAFEFYRDGLGLQLVGELRGDQLPEPVQFLLDARTHLMLVPTGGFGWVLGKDKRVAEAGVSECVLGLALASKAELDALVERARAAGATIGVEPGQQPWGYSANLRDPDGHVWLLVQQ